MTRSKTSSHPQLQKNVEVDVNDDEPVALVAKKGKVSMTISNRKRRQLGLKPPSSSVPMAEEERESDTSYSYSVDDEDDLTTVGPEDKSLLGSFENHVAYKVWKSPKTVRGALKTITHWGNLSMWDVNDECESFRKRFRQTGFNNIALYSYRYIDRALISAFIECWHPETNNFHLPFGEMTITLDDVYHILGVPVEGAAVYGAKGPSNILLPECVQLLTKYIGISEKDAIEQLQQAYSLKLVYLRTHLKEKCTDRSSKAYIDKCVRGYITYVLGSVALTDKSGDKISAYYLQSLKDLDNCDKTSWGMGILAYLYRQLGAASRSEVKQISGCLTLLQAWICEHFVIAKHASAKNYDDNTMPRMRRWTTQINPSDVDSPLYETREFLDDLSPADVIWDPYVSRRQGKPIADVTFFSGLLLCYDVAEMYYPKRVLRQFGRVQQVPRAPSPVHPKSNLGKTHATYKVFHEISWIVKNWKDHVLAIDARSTPVGKPWDCGPGYMEWFKKYSHPYVINPKYRRLAKPANAQVLQQYETLGNELPQVAKLMKGITSAGWSQDLEDVLSCVAKAYEMLKEVMKSSSISELPDDDDTLQGDDDENIPLASLPSTRKIRSRATHKEVVSKKSKKSKKKK